MGERWRNRIVGHGEELVSQILANPLNWRVHPREQQDALLGAIRDVGFIRSVTVNKVTGNMVDGHMRVLLADREGIESIPTEYVELTPEEEAEALATLDPISALAVTDGEQLALLLEELNADELSESVSSLLADLVKDATPLGENDSRHVAAADEERGGAVEGLDYVTFSFGESRGNVSRQTYDQFVELRKQITNGFPQAAIGDVLAEIFSRGQAR